MKKYEILKKAANLIAILFVLLSILLNVLVAAPKMRSGYSFPFDWTRELLRILWVSGGFARMVWNIMLGLSLVGGVKIFVLLQKNQKQIKMFFSKQGNL